MKVCQINTVYGKGSTGKIVRDLHEELLRSGHESIVIYPVRNKDENGPFLYTVSNKHLSRASAVYRRLSGRQFDGAYIQTSRIINILKREKPDVVHLHCINGNNINIYRLLRYLAVNKIKTILTIHAEFMYTGGCEHAYDCEKWKIGCKKCTDKSRGTLVDGSAHTYKSFWRSYALFDADKFRFVAVSPWLETRAKSSPMLSRFRGCTVLNGVDTSLYTYTTDKNLREELGLAPEEKVIFHVTANFNPTTDNIKGGKYVIELAEKLKGEKVRIIIASNRTAECALPDNCLSVGRIESSEKLSRIYSMSDLTLITSKRETFSMPTAESLCCGTPVVGFLAGGPESIALPAHSRFVEYGDVDSLYCAAKEMLAAKNDKAKISKEAKKIYARQQMLFGYMNLYTEKE